MFYAGGLVGLGIAVVVAVFYWRFLTSLPRAVRQLYMLAAALYVSGEAIAEFFSGWYLDSVGGNDLIYKTITTVEETCGMLGILIAIAATLYYIQRTFGEIDISLSGDGEAVARDITQPVAAPPVPLTELAPQPVLTITAQEPERGKVNGERPSTPTAR
jgi:hypothetical protein